MNIFDDVFYQDSRKFSNTRWETLDPTKKWRALPDVSWILEWCRHAPRVFQDLTVFSNSETLEHLKRLHAYFLRIIQMLESGESYHVTGTSPQPGFYLTRMWIHQLRDIVRMDLEGKFSPEARPFLARKLRTFAKELQAFISGLEQAE